MKRQKAILIVYDFHKTNLKQRNDHCNYLSKNLSTTRLDKEQYQLISPCQNCIDANCVLDLLYADDFEFKQKKKTQRR